MKDRTGFWIVVILLVAGAIIAGCLGKTEVAETCAGVLVIGFFWTSF